MLKKRNGDRQSPPGLFFAIFYPDGLPQFLCRWKDPTGSVDVPVVLPDRTYRRFFPFFFWNTAP
jgi:hypothetical protein